MGMRTPSDRNAVRRRGQDLCPPGVGSPSDDASMALMTRACNVTFSSACGPSSAGEPRRCACRVMHVMELDKWTMRPAGRAKRKSLIGLPRTAPTVFQIYPSHTST
jgi:hypothetical protein